MEISGEVFDRLRNKIFPSDVRVSALQPHFSGNSMDRHHPITKPKLMSCVGSLTKESVNSVQVANLNTDARIVSSLDILWLIAGNWLQIESNRLRYTTTTTTRNQLVATMPVSHVDMRLTISSS